MARQQCASWQFGHAQELLAHAEVMVLTVGDVARPCSPPPTSSRRPRPTRTR